jgi:IclR family acetate operon transcriptional repressor
VRFTDSTITDLPHLTSELEDIHKKGYAFDNGEHEDEVRCIATPIFDLSGQAVAALSISGPAARIDPLGENGEMIALAKQAAENISHMLGHNALKNSWSKE